MEKIKKLLLILVFVVGVITLSLAIFISSLAPNYSGTVTSDGLKGQVNVYYDTYGIPHIYARTELDAQKALGYVHAQDRLWQMELLRRIAKGRLSEVFGEDLVPTDKLMLGLGIDRATSETLVHLDTTSLEVRLAQAYLDGINQFIKEGPKPLEFYLTGIEATPFNLEDVYNTIGYMAFSFAMAHKTDPLLSDLARDLDSTYIAELGMDGFPNTTLIRNFKRDSTAADSLESTLSAAMTKALERLPIPQLEGSNSWVIGPQKTKSGKVLFANDPHIGFAQPCVWFEAHIHTPLHETYGYYLGGVPFPLMAHNKKMAYGLTMFENDDIDFYYEEQQPENESRYLGKSGWEDFGKVTRNIAVKDEGPEDFSYRYTDKGPVVNDILESIKSSRPVSMSWIYTQRENRLLEALYRLSHAQNMEAFEEGVQLVHAPGLNIMYGDAMGNVAWWAAAQLYAMPEGVSTKMIIERHPNQDIPLRDINFEENPQAVNPPWHFVYSANNQPDSIAGMLYPGYYLPDNRAERIRSVVEFHDDWDLEMVADFINDNVSEVNPKIAAALSKYIEVGKLDDGQIALLDQMNTWDGEYTLDQIEGTVYHRWIYYFLKATLADEMGMERFTRFMQTHMSKRLIAPLAMKEESVWWDDISTIQEVETKGQLVNKAFLQALRSLDDDFGSAISSWTWDRVHHLEHQHPIGQVKLLRSLLNVGPFPVSGTREVVNNMGFQYDPSGFYEVGSGPSTRRIIDFSDIENSISILPTGQSGNPFSKHYRDQAELYVQGKFRKMLLDKDEIQASATDLLTFKPKP